MSLEIGKVKSAMNRITDRKKKGNPSWRKRTYPNPPPHWHSVDEINEGLEDIHGSKNDLENLLNKNPDHFKKDSTDGWGWRTRNIFQRIIWKLKN